MITNNLLKKDLVKRLLAENKITVDEAFILLEGDNVINFTPTYIPPYPNPIPTDHPYYPLPVIFCDVDSHPNNITYTTCNCTPTNCTCKRN